MKIFSGTLLITLMGFLNLVYLSSQAGVNPQQPLWEQEVDNEELEPATEVWEKVYPGERKRLPNGAIYTANHEVMLKMTYRDKTGPITIQDKQEMFVAYPPSSGRGIVRVSANPQPPSATRGGSTSRGPRARHF